MAVDGSLKRVFSSDIENDDFKELGSSIDLANLTIDNQKNPSYQKAA
jgi:hypothetical protein